MADDAELTQNLKELQRQEEALNGLIQLNSDNTELPELLESVREARQLTEQSLMALKQSAMLESLEALAAPPEATPRPQTPPPVLPLAGERVLAYFAPESKFYPATVEAVFPPHAMRLRWLFATQQLPAVVLPPSAVRRFDGVDLNGLSAGAQCLALRPNAVAWSWAKVLQRGGGSRRSGSGDVAASGEERILVEFAEATPKPGEGGDDLEAAGGQCLLPARRVAPVDHAIVPLEEESSDEGSGHGCSDNEGDSEGEEGEEGEAGEEGEEGEAGKGGKARSHQEAAAAASAAQIRTYRARHTVLLENGEAAASSSGDNGWYGARARGDAGDFENHTRGIGSRLMRSMGWGEGQGLGRRAEGPVHCLALERLPQPGSSGYRGLSIDAVAEHRARRAERRTEGVDESGEVTGVRRGGKKRNRGDTGRWRRARRNAGLDPVERKQVERTRRSSSRSSSSSSSSGGSSGSCSSRVW